MKILIVRISSLGDVILSTHLPRLISKRFPESRIDYLVSKQFASLLQFNPYISQIIEYDKTLPFSKHILSMLSLYNPMHYDIILDLQNNIRSWVATFGKSSTIFRFSKRRLMKLRMVFGKFRPSKIENIPDLYKRTFPSLNGIDDGLGLEIWTKADLDNGIYFPHSRKTTKRIVSKIAIAPGAKHFTKRLPIETFRKLVELLLQTFQCKILLLGGEEDFELAKELLLDETLVENYAGRLDYLSTAEKLDEVDLVISNDSAMIHFASARKVPVVQIFGSTIPEFGFIPYKVPYEIVEMKDIKCRPCTHYGRSKCPRRHFKCMNSITPMMIMEATKKLITKL